MPGNWQLSDPLGAKGTVGSQPAIRLRERLLRLRRRRTSRYSRRKTRGGRWMT